MKTAQDEKLTSEGTEDEKVASVVNTPVEEEKVTQEVKDSKKPQEPEKSESPESDEVKDVSVEKSHEVKIEGVEVPGQRKEIEVEKTPTEQSSAQTASEVTENEAEDKKVESSEADAETEAVAEGVGNESEVESAPEKTVGEPEVEEKEPSPQEEEPKIEEKTPEDQSAPKTSDTVPNVPLNAPLKSESVEDKSGDEPPIEKKNKRIYVISIFAAVVLVILTAIVGFYYLTGQKEAEEVVPEVAEEVEPIPHDRAARGHTELLVLEGHDLIEDVILRTPVRVAEVAGKRPREHVGARLGDGIHLRGGRPALGRVEPVRDELEFGDLIPAVPRLAAHARGVHHHLAVEVEGVVDVVLSVDRDGVAADRRRPVPRRQQRERHPVAALYRELRQLPRIDVAAH